MTKYKLLGIDLDGTLLSKLKRISKSNLLAIKKYVDEGGIPVITTGRSIVSAEKIAIRIENFTNSKAEYVIAFNGAYIKNMMTNDVQERMIPDSMVREIKEYVEKNKLILWAYTRESTQKKAVYVTKNFANLIVRLGKGVNILKLNSSVKDLSSYKLNILSFRKSKITKALYELKQKYNDILTFSHSHSRLIEVNLNNTNKGEGVHFVANELNITQKEIAVIGDSNNDLPAFLMSSLKIAVKTKSKLLKQHASYYLNYKRNAVADAINKYILPLRDIKLIASDLDGTLLRNKTKEIDDRAKQLIKKVVDQFDKKFVICTGRSIDDTLVVVDYFHFKNIKNVFLICVNGGCIYDVANQKYLFESTMQKTSVEKILTIFKNFQDDKTRLKEIAIEAFIDYDEQSLIKRTPQTHYLINKDYIYNFYTTKHPGMLKNFWAERVHKVIDKNMPMDRVMKFIMHFESPEDRARIIAILEQYDGEFEISSSGGWNVEIMPHNVNKGNALLRLCNFLNIDIKDTMPIGDEKNDISMLSLSPNSVTLASSYESVRQASRHVLNAEASAIVAEAISKFVLKGK